MQDTDHNTMLVNRSALEALRNGVPNQEAVRLLGCAQPKAEADFAGLLNRAEDVDDPPESALGMLVTGGFGTGKSHLLTYLEHQALERGYVCSKVVVSKETPLYDLGKLFNSAVDNAHMPNHRGRLMEELGQALKPQSRAYDEFYVWAHDTETNGLSQYFPASLRVHADSRDLELNNQIEGFWGGSRLKVSELKSGLRAIGQLQNYAVSAPKAAELPKQRLRFATELIKAAGYKGWVVLLDEIELIGSYSQLQRGRSYAELARLMGQVVTEKYPGLVVAGTITDDFVASVISPSGQKKDRDYIPHKLAVRHEYLVPLAESGMQLLQQRWPVLDAPTDESLEQTLATLRRIHSQAYRWNAPPLPIESGGVGIQGRMRFKVRSAINQWDLLRIYPNSRPDIEGTEYRNEYFEDHDLEISSKDDAEDGE